MGKLFSELFNDTCLKYKNMYGEKRCNKFIKKCEEERQKEWEKLERLNRMRMKEFPKYPKIQSLYKRDMTKKHKPLIESDYTRDEYRVLKNAVWESYEKIDGTNIRIHWDGEGFLVGGRTYAAKLHPILVDKIYNLLDAEKFKEKFDDTPVTIYGEGYGNNIQKVGPLYSSEYNFIMFDILIGNFWLTYETMKDLGEFFNIDVVPRIMTTVGFDSAIDLCKEGFKSSIGNAPAEGVIIKPALGLKDRAGKRIISKIKCSDYVEKSC